MKIKITDYILDCKTETEIEISEKELLLLSGQKDIGYELFKFNQKMRTVSLN